MCLALMIAIRITVTVFQAPAQLILTTALRDKVLLARPEAWSSAFFTVQLSHPYMTTVVLEKTPESPLDCKEIQPVHSEGDQPWDFVGRNDAKAETPYFGHLMRRLDSLEKTQMLGGIGGRRRRG